MHDEERRVSAIAAELLGADEYHVPLHDRELIVDLIVGLERELANAHAVVRECIAGAQERRRAG